MPHTTSPDPPLKEAKALSYWERHSKPLKARAPGGGRKANPSSSGRGRKPPFPAPRTQHRLTAPGEGHKQKPCALEEEQETLLLKTHPEQGRQDGGRGH